MREPTVTGLAWYLSGVFVLMAVMVSFITYHPDVVWMGVVLPLAFVALSFIWCVVAVFIGRLPARHWVHESKPVRVGLSMFTVAATVLLVMVG